MSDLGKEASDLQARDRLIFRWLGGFFVVFGVLVWIGLFWPQASEARLVTVVAGAILVAVGGGAMALGRTPRV